MVLVLTFLLAKDQLENIIINHEKYYMMKNILNLELFLNKLYFYDLYKLLLYLHNQMSYIKFNIIFLFLLIVH
jgi:hypothetical protein